jgi:hypothetical protein
VISTGLKILYSFLYRNYITHIHLLYFQYIQTLYPKVGLVEEIRGRGQEGNRVANNNEVYHICVKTRHKETH